MVEVHTPPENYGWYVMFYTTRTRTTRPSNHVTRLLKYDDTVPFFFYKRYNTQTTFTTNLQSQVVLIISPCVSELDLSPKESSR